MKKCNGEIKKKHTKIAIFIVHKKLKLYLGEKGNL